MVRGPLTQDEIDTLTKISDLADQIYALAAPLDKHPRHALSNAAKFIRWTCYDYAHPGDPDAAKALASLNGNTRAIG